MTEAEIFNIEYCKIDGGAMFGVVPKTLWSRYYGSDNLNMCTLALRSLIVTCNDRVILTDTGWGDKQDEKFFRYIYQHGGEGLLGGLANRGYDPGDITDIFLTHLHADHCGGCLRNRISGNGQEHVFPNATYHVSRMQWEWAVKGNPREADSFLKENFMALADDNRLNLMEEDRELFPGFEARIVKGHTPGLMYAIIDYKNRKLAYVGDLIPTTAHLPLIWNSSYEINPLKSIDEKRDFLEEAFEKDYILVFQHDENTECCNLRNTPKGIRINDTFRLEEI